MDRVELEEALEFYDIKNELYKKKCFECLEYINSDSVILNEFLNIKNALFTTDYFIMKDMWMHKDINDLFVNNVLPFTSNLLLLSGYLIHRDNIKKYGIDMNQVMTQIKRVRECLLNDILIRNYPGIRVSQMLWATLFINFQIFEVGRLQYQICKNNILKIHIPRGDDLDIDLVKSSLKDSEKYISKYYNIEGFEYHCDSWLLSPQIHHLIDKNSNIYRFYDLFLVSIGDDCLDDILNFVYNRIDECSFNDLCEDTSLQRIIKRYLLSGNRILKGCGILKYDLYD